MDDIPQDKPPRSLSLRDRQKVCRVDKRLFRKILNHYLRKVAAVASYELCFHLVDSPEMAEVNWQFLQHEGSTDVITFDHADAPDAENLYGEIFICLADAVAQARRFKTTWQSELTRYAVHGILHLQGHDDLSEDLRKVMKREENRGLRILKAEFNLAQLSCPND
jgi:probable rRNA maturation factor